MSNEMVINKKLVNIFEIWGKHGFLACSPHPPDRLRRSGNLSQWFWTISCSASSWPFASLARWPSLLEGSSNSTWGEDGKQIGSKQHDQGRSWGHEKQQMLCLFSPPLSHVSHGVNVSKRWRFWIESLWVVLEISFVTKNVLHCLICVFKNVVLLHHTLVGSVNVLSRLLCKQGFCFVFPLGSLINVWMRGFN